MEGLILLLFLIGPILVALELFCVFIVVSAFYKLCFARHELRMSNLYNRRNILISIVIPYGPAAAMMLFYEYIHGNEALDFIFGLHMAYIWLSVVLFLTWALLHSMYRIFKL